MRPLLTFFAVFICYLIIDIRQAFTNKGVFIMGNALEQLKKETKDDAKLYGCIKELYEQGVPFEELKGLIPDIKRTREQLQMKRILENNNEILMSMFTKEMSFLLDAKERQEEEQFKKLDQLIRQQQSFKPCKMNGPYRTVSLFCNNNFCLFLKLGILIIIFVTINKHYNIGILLDSPGFTEI